MHKQQGYIFRAGDSWYLKYRDTVIVDGAVERKQMTRRLVRVAPEDKRLKNAPPEVQELALEFLEPINNGKVTPESTQTLAAFVEHVYFPNAKKAASTMNTDRNRWITHLEHRVGSIRIRDFRTVDGEQVIADIARQNDLSRSTLKQCKSLLSAIFKQAKRLGLRDSNPMQDVSIPKVRGKGETHAYSLDEVSRMLAVLDLRCAAIVGVAAYAGLRRSEIQGLTIASDQGTALSIDQSVWEGHVAETKTESSKGLVPIIPQLRHLLDLHRASLSGAQLVPTAPLFAASNGKPLRLNNLLRDEILPAFRTAGIAWGGWHSFRRSLATNLHDQGVPDITIQAILRHSSVQVTRACYIKTLPKQVTGAMASFSSTLPEVVYNCDINSPEDEKQRVN